jgi:hypothetical protein
MVVDVVTISNSIVFVLTRFQSIYYRLVFALLRTHWLLLILRHLQGRQIFSLDNGTDIIGQNFVLFIQILQSFSFRIVLYWNWINLHNFLQKALNFLLNSGGHFLVLHVFRKGKNSRFHIFFDIFIYITLHFSFFLLMFSIQLAPQTDIAVFDLF